MRYFGDVYPDVRTYRPLPANLRRCILDANVLLDAALISDGAAILSLRELRQRGVEFVTSARAYEEAIERVRDYRGDLSSIEPILQSFVASNVQVLDSRVANDSHDEHIIALVHDGASCALTEDLPLILRLNALERHGRTLREVLYGCVNPQPGMLTTFFGTGLGADGHVFVKAEAHPDICHLAREWNVFEIQDFVRLCYDSALRAFVLFMGKKRSLLLPFAMEGERPFALCMSYSTGRETSLTLRVGWVGESTDTTRTTVAIAALEAAPSSNIIWMNSFEKKEGWHGHFQLGTFGPYRLARESWRASRELVGVAPSTLTADLSLTATLLCEVRGEDCRRPRWDQVVQLVHRSFPGFYPGRRAGERARQWFDQTPGR